MSAVFGPGRPAAAYRALVELEQAIAAFDAAFWGPGEDAARARLNRAREHADQYSEYSSAAAALART